MIDRMFVAHPRSVGETYAEHARVALSFGVALIAAGLACLVHAVVPALFTRTASTTIRRLHARLGAPRGHGPAPAQGQLLYEI